MYEFYHFHLQRVYSGIYRFFGIVRNSYDVVVQSPFSKPIMFHFEKSAIDVNYSLLGYYIEWIFWAMSLLSLWMSDSSLICPEYKISSLLISCSILALPGEDFLTIVSWKVGFCLDVGYSGLAPIHRLGKGIILRLHVYIQYRSGLLSSTTQGPELLFVNTGHYWSTAQDSILNTWF